MDAYDIFLEFGIYRDLPVAVVPIEYLRKVRHVSMPTLTALAIAKRLRMDRDKITDERRKLPIGYVKATNSEIRPESLSQVSTKPTIAAETVFKATPSGRFRRVPKKELRDGCFRHRESTD